MGGNGMDNGEPARYVRTTGDRGAFGNTWENGNVPQNSRS